jgi:hypothetical protein
MTHPPTHTSRYQRYHIETKPAPDIVSWPNPFLVKVNRIQLAKLLISEIFHHGSDVKTITSRPCMYGTFSGPIGGFAPRPQHCVGCLRCTTQHPDTVQILRNPARERLGDSYFTAKHVDAVVYEAKTGSIPVKGAGYRGAFGGGGWDGMWTDMSEIVRPTRDGIHGREFISTVVEVGEKPGYLVFDDRGQPTGLFPRVVQIPIPIIFDTLPPLSAPAHLFNILSQAASEVQILSVVPLAHISGLQTQGAHLVPLVQPGEENAVSDLPFAPKLVALNAAQAGLDSLQSSISKLQSQIPDSIIAVRSAYPREGTLMKLYEFGLRVFHLSADYHGRGEDGTFVIDLIRRAHSEFVQAGVRDEVTLIGSGGIIAAEHVPKAIIAGLDLVAIDTPLLVALQAHFEGECTRPEASQFTLSKQPPHDWGVQRVKNLLSAWRDQMLEILGAMGLREVRRLRGEMGRAMFQVDLEREAFAEIEGYAD